MERSTGASTWTFEELLSSPVSALEPSAVSTRRLSSLSEASEDISILKQQPASSSAASSSTGTDFKSRASSAIHPSFAADDSYAPSRRRRKVADLAPADDPSMHHVTASAPERDLASPRHMYQELTNGAAGGEEPDPERVRTVFLESMSEEEAGAQSDAESGVIVTSLASPLHLRGASRDREHVYKHKERATEALNAKYSATTARRDETAQNETPSKQPEYAFESTNVAAPSQGQVPREVSRVNVTTRAPPSQLYVASRDLEHADRNKERTAEAPNGKVNAINISKYETMQNETPSKRLEPASNSTSFTVPSQGLAAHEMSGMKAFAPPYHLYDDSKNFEHAHRNKERTPEAPNGKVNAINISKYDTMQNETPSKRLEPAPKSTSFTVPSQGHAAREMSGMTVMTSAPPYHLYDDSKYIEHAHRKKERTTEAPPNAKDSVTTARKYETPQNETPSILPEHDYESTSVAAPSQGQVPCEMSDEKVTTFGPPPHQHDVARDFEHANGNKEIAIEAPNAKDSVTTTRKKETAQNETLSKPPEPVKRTSAAASSHGQVPREMSASKVTASITPPQLRDASMDCEHADTHKEGTTEAPNTKDSATTISKNETVQNEALAKPPEPASKSTSIAAPSLGQDPCVVPGVTAAGTNQEAPDAPKLAATSKDKCDIWAEFSPTGWPTTQIRDQTTRKKQPSTTRPQQSDPSRGLGPALSKVQGTTSSPESAKDLSSKGADKKGPLTPGKLRPAFTVSGATNASVVSQKSPVRTPVTENETQPMPATSSQHGLLQYPTKGISVPLDGGQVEWTAPQYAPLIQPVSVVAAAPVSGRQVLDKSRTVADGSDRAEPDKSTLVKREGSPHTARRRQDGETKNTAATPSNQTAIRAGADHAVEWPTRKEHLLYPLALCLMFVLILVLVLLFWPYRSLSQQSRQGRGATNKLSDATCNSVRCMENTLYLSNFVSRGRLDPCDNFYAFICSRRTTRFASPFSHSVTTDDEYGSFLEDKLHLSLRSKSRNSRVLRPLKYLYERCHDVDGINYSGWEALLELMSEVSLQGFPLTVPTGGGGDFSVWKSAATLFRKTGTAALLSVGVAAHPSLTARDIASVGPPELLTTDGGVDTKEAIRLYTTAVFVICNDLKIQNFPLADTFALVKFASELEKLGQLRLERNAAKLNVVDSPSDLLVFLTEVLHGSQQTLFSGARSETLILSPDLVGDVLNVVARTEVQTAMNYLGLRLIIQMAPFTPRSMLTDVYSTLLYGKLRKGLPRWQLCVRVVERALYPLVYAHLFADLKVNATAPTLQEFVNGVIAEFTTEMDNSSYLDGSSKAGIRDILSRSVINLLGPGWTKDKASVDRYIDSLPSAEPSLQGLKAYVGYHQHTFFHALERGSRMRWTRSAYSTDCWSEPYPRTLYVPLLAFNGTQVLESGVADAMQLSRLAPRLGRCLFDMLFDEASLANGSKHSLNATTWLKVLNAEECFQKRQEYLRFSGFRDVLAARVSYRFFAKSVDADEVLPHPPIAGRGPVTAAQMFFASLMLQNCDGGGRPYWVTKSVEGDGWSAALQQMDEFSEAYNCTLHSTMNPMHKCLRT